MISLPCERLLPAKFNTSSETFLEQRGNEAIRGFLNRLFFGVSAPGFRFPLPSWILFILLLNAGFACQGQTTAGATIVEAGKERGKEVIMKSPDGLTDEQGKYLLDVARNTIRGSLFGDKGGADKDDNLPPIFNEKRGTFVTLTSKGNLRGCIGHIIAQESLIEGIRENAINAAFKDPRFKPVGKIEWEQLKIEISILTDPKPLSYSDAEDLLKKIRPCIDGVILKKGYHQSTFLPQVWDQLPQKEDFLSHLCLKAGLDGNAWRRGDLEVSTYQVQAFEEE